MTQRKQFEKVMAKAVENGYIEPVNVPQHNMVPSSVFVDIHYVKGNFMTRQHILLSHDFAKAFFGEEPIGAMFAWQFHLREAVLAESIIDYYHKNL
jgi:hypothetical protein